jgi:hypothetical protein
VTRLKLSAVLTSVERFELSLADLLGVAPLFISFMVVSLSGVDQLE